MIRSKTQTQDMFVVNSVNSNTNAKPELFQNIPNPFNENTIIKYNIPDTFKSAYIMIYDMQGKQLKKYTLTKGSDQILIQAREFSPGIYLYTLIMNQKEIDTKRMIITD